MKNSFLLSGLAVALLGLGVVHGQDPSNSQGGLGIPPASPPGVQGSAGMPAPTLAIPQGNEPIPVFGDPPATPPQAPDRTPPGISSWLAYPRGPGCCCQVGGDGPIEWEVALRSGVSVPFGSGIYASDLKPGWDIEAGLRTLLFNRAGDAAWTVELGVTNIHWGSNHNQQATITNFQDVVTPTTIIPIPSLNVTPGGLNDTFLNLSAGREVYLWGGPAVCNGEPRWRMGWDMGGRWGTSKLDMDGVQPQAGLPIVLMHKVGSISGVFASVHTDIEVPCGCWIISVGVRAEYGYIFSDILQGQNNTDLQTFNLMFTIGGRF